MTAPLLWAYAPCVPKPSSLGTSVAAADKTLKTRASRPRDLAIFIQTRDLIIAGMNGILTVQLDPRQ